MIRFIMCMFQLLCRYNINVQFCACFSYLSVYVHNEMPIYRCKLFATKKLKHFKFRTVMQRLFYQSLQNEGSETLSQNNYYKYKS